MAMNSKKRKFLATSLTATMVAAAVAPAAGFAAEQQKDFPDLAGYGWATEAIDYLVGKGAIEGNPDGTFKPGNSIKRGEAAKILAIALGLDVDHNAKTDFADAKDHWSSSYIAAITAENPNVINGYQGKFRPEDSITRQELAKMVVTAYGLELDEKADVEFSDNTDWGKDEIEILASLGVVEGYDGGLFKPNEPVKRAETAVFVHRAEVDSKRVPVKQKEAVAPEVVSVSAINAKQVEVTFNQPVDSLTALNKDNYKIQTNADAQPVALSTKDATADLDLSDDGKVVTITTTTDINTDFGTGGSAIVAGTPFKFTVDGVKAKDGSAIEKKTFTISSKDEIAPSFLTATAKAKTTTTRVTLEFNEPVDVTGAIAYVGGQAATVAQGSTPTTVVLTTAQALDAGKEYELTLLNFKDFAGNFLDKNPTNTKFTVTADAVAPVVQNVKVVRDNLVEVTFDKSMDATTFTGNARILDVNGVVQGTSLSATIKPGTAGKTVRLTTASAVPFNEAGTFAGTLVLGNGIKDTSGNAKGATSHSITLTKDTVKPTVASASYVAPGAQYAGNTYANGAIVVKLSEEVSATDTPANFKLISSTGVEVSSPAISTVTVNSLDAKEVILTMAGALPTDTYTLRVANEAVADLSTQANKNVAAVTTVKVDGSSDTVKPTVAIAASTPIVAATSQTSGSKIKLDMTDNVGLDLATVQNVTNYLLDGKPLPAGSYVTLAHNGSSSNSAAATDITVTLNIPEKSIAKSANYTLNVNNIKDKAGNVAAPFVHSPVALVDDISPELTKAEISSNGLLVLTFSEAVNAVTTGTEADFEFTINGSTVAVANNTNIATFTDGTGTDTGKYVVTFKANVDAGVDNDAATTADNRLFLDVNGDGAYTAGTDILLQTGTTTAVGAVATLDINMFSSLKVKVADTASVVKDTSSITSGPNPIKVGTTVTVK